MKGSLSKHERSPVNIAKTSFSQAEANGGPSKVRSRQPDQVKSIGEPLWLLARLGYLVFVSWSSAECLLTAFRLHKGKNQSAPPSDDFSAHHRFSSKWAQNVHIFKGYRKPVATSCNQLSCMQFSVSEKPELATAVQLHCGSVQSGPVSVFFRLCELDFKTLARHAKMAVRVSGVRVEDIIVLNTDENESSADRR